MFSKVSIASPSGVRISTKDIGGSTSAFDADDLPAELTMCIPVGESTAQTWTRLPLLELPRLSRLCTDLSSSTFKTLLWPRRCALCTSLLRSSGLLLSSSDMENNLESDPVDSHSKLSLTQRTQLGSGSPSSS